MKETVHIEMSVEEYEHYVKLRKKFIKFQDALIYISDTLHHDCDSCKQMRSTAIRALQGLD